MTLLIQLFTIFLLGFIGGSIPGPILTSTFTEALRKGFIKSLRVISYAAISEIIVATLILSIFFSIHIPQSIFYGISFVGALVLIWIATQIWSIKNLHENEKIFNFTKIFLLTIFNGPLWIFWSTICVPQAYVLNQKITGGAALFLLTFELGWFTSTAVLTFLFSRFRPILTKEGVVGKVFKIFAIILAIFAVRLVLTSFFYFYK